MTLFRALVHEMCTIFSPQKCPETPYPIPAPQVSHTGSHSCLQITVPGRLSCSPLLRSAVPLRPNTLPRHLTTPFGRVRSRSHAPSPLRLTPLRHLPPFPCGRSRSQPIAPISATPDHSLRSGQEPLPCAIIVPSPSAAAPASALLWQEPLTAVSLYPGNLSSGPFLIPRSAAAAVRCAGETTVPCSFLRSAALTLRSLLQIPAFCLSAQGITARLAAFLHTPTLCADRRTERQARLAAGGVFQSLLH